MTALTLLSSVMKHPSLLRSLKGDSDENNALITTDDEVIKASPLSFDLMLGVTLCIVGASVVQIGYAYQKKSHIMTASSMPEDKCRRTWIFGFCVFLIGQLINFVSLSFGAETIVSVIGLDATLISNCILAPLILKERLRNRDVVATGIIAIGAALIVYFSSGASQDYTVTELTDLFLRPPFIILAIVIILLLLGLQTRLYFATEKKKRLSNYRKQTQKQDTPTQGTGSNSLEVALNITTQSAICGAVGFTLAKCSTLVIKESFTASNQFAVPQTYAIIGVWLFAAVNEVRLLNIALKHGDSLMIIPAQYVMNSILCIICGLVYFEEYKFFPLSHVGALCAGSSMTAVGIYVIALRGRDSEGAATEKDFGLGNLVEDDDILAKPLLLTL